MTALKKRGHAISETVLGEIRKIAFKWLILRTAIEKSLTYRADCSFHARWIPADCDPDFSVEHNLSERRRSIDFVGSNSVRWSASICS